MTDFSTLYSNVRLLAGVQQEEMPNSDLDTLFTMAERWLEGETGVDYVVGNVGDYDDAIIYFTCYLASIAKREGRGIKSITIDSVSVVYDDSIEKYKRDAIDAILRTKKGMVQKSNYNANSVLGVVDWLKNIDGSDSTKNIREVPSGV